MTNYRDGFNQHAMRIAAELLDMADKIEHQVVLNEPVDDSAEEIIRIIMRGFANLQLGQLLRWMLRVMSDDAMESDDK